MLVYPGGDREACRPFAQRNRVDLAGRTGFIRLAMEERVPIIPVICAGAHEQLIVLSRGARLAELLGTRRWLRTESLPWMFALPWGLTSAYLPYRPLPSQISIEFGAPFAIPPDADPRDEQALSELNARFCDRMQLMLNALTLGRVPIVGRRGG